MMDSSKGLLSVPPPPPPRHNGNGTDDGKNSIFVKRLPPDTNTVELTKHFDQYAQVKHAQPVTYHNTQRCKGFGFITFYTKQDALYAAEYANHSIFKGNRLLVELQDDAKSIKGLRIRSSPRHSPDGRSSFPGNQSHSHRDSSRDRKSRSRSIDNLFRPNVETRQDVSSVRSHYRRDIGGEKRRSRSFSPYYRDRKSRSRSLDSHYRRKYASRQEVSSDRREKGRSRSFTSYYRDRKSRSRSLGNRYRRNLGSRQDVSSDRQRNRRDINQEKRRSRSFSPFYKTSRSPVGKRNSKKRKGRSRSHNRTRRRRSRSYDSRSVSSCSFSSCPSYSSYSRSRSSSVHSRKRRSKSVHQRDKGSLDRYYHHSQSERNPKRKYTVVPHQNWRRRSRERSWSRTSNRAIRRESSRILAERRQQSFHSRSPARSFGHAIAEMPGKEGQHSLIISQKKRDRQEPDFKELPDLKKVKLDYSRSAVENLPNVHTSNTLDYESVASQHPSNKEVVDSKVDSLFENVRIESALNVEFIPKFKKKKSTVNSDGINQKSPVKQNNSFSSTPAIELSILPSTSLQQKDSSLPAVENKTESVDSSAKFPIFAQSQQVSEESESDNNAQSDEDSDEEESDADSSISSSPGRSSASPSRLSVDEQSCSKSVSDDEQNSANGEGLKYEDESQEVAQKHDNSTSKGASGGSIDDDVQEMDSKGKSHSSFEFEEKFFEPNFLLRPEHTTMVQYDWKNESLELGIPKPRKKKSIKYTGDPKKTITDTDEAFAFPLPSKKIFNKKEKFLLPYDIYYQVRLEAVLDHRRLDSTPTDKEPPPYFPLRSSIIGNVPKIDDHQEKCRCPLIPKVRGCKKKCMNRMTRVECSNNTCALGKLCSNRDISRRRWADCFVKKAGEKGWGLFVKQPVKKGKLVIEYVGEVISSSECEYRLKTHYRDEKNFYMLTLDSNWVIDATRMGAIARFTNHSCSPNSETQKWFVDGRSRVGIFALRDLEVGEEVTIDYRYERFGGKKEACLCGAKNCRGFLGAKPPPTKVNNSKRELKIRDQETEKTSVVETSKSESQLLIGTIHMLDGAQNYWDRQEIAVEQSLPFLRRNVTSGLDSRRKLISSILPDDKVESLKAAVLDNLKLSLQEVLKGTNS